MPLNIGSRSFAPRLFTSLVTVALLVLLVSLGRWQLARADARQKLFDEFAAGSDATRLIDGTTPTLPRYSHVEATGRYDPARQILIDNMTDPDGHAGYYVLTPFHLSDGRWLLVDRGWVALGDSRAHKPDVAVSEASRVIHGRIDDLPKPGIRMGRPAALMAPFPAVANYPASGDISRLLGETQWTSAGEQVLLDAGEPDGYGRRWAPPGFPPMRNLAYAVQWFGLAAALTVIYLVTNLHPRKAT